MEVAEPQPGPSPAAGPQTGAEEIDMSLDDIIKRHRKEQTDAKAAGDGRRQQTKSRNLAYGFGRPRFRAWMQRNLQASVQVATADLSLLFQGNKSEDAFTKSSSGQPEARRRPPSGPRRFRAAAAGTSTPGRRPFALNRGPGFQQKQMQQRFSKAYFQRGLETSRCLGRWQVKPSPGAVLTVSVANPQASQTSAPGAKRPFLRNQRPPPRITKPQPKGVMLRFNFRAMANQTSLTLDERFSGLRNKRRFAAARSARRTVTMP
ncbi:UNVERIFIED_CONTAM: hypothetical protein H355_011074 [Colinus virginianus]|nr:hypothetical protein H355_011074 [Colinus virginianus]